MESVCMRDWHISAVHVCLNLMVASCN